VKKENREKRHCPKEEILLLIDGKLKGEEQTSLEKHIEQCSDCREYLEFVQGLVEVIKEIPAPEKEACPSTLTLSLYASGDLDPETVAHVNAHILYCDECFKEVLQLEKMEATWAETVKESLKIEQRYKLAIKFLKDSVKILEATGRIFQGRELQPALVRLRGPRKECYRNIIKMTQDIGQGISVEIKITRTAPGRNDISVFTSTTREEIKKWIGGLIIALSPEGEKPSISEVTSVAGEAELGEWDDGRYLLEVSEAKGKIADIRLDLQSQ